MGTADTLQQPALAQRWLTGSRVFLNLFWAVAIAGVLGWAWLNRDEGYLMAETGLGYWLGIGGGVMMVLLLTYSFRKRWRLLSKAFPI